MPTSLDRRTFVKLGLAAATTTAASIVSAEARAAESLLVFFDGRYSDSRRFAESFASSGVERFDTASDVAQLWYSRLRSQAQTRPLRMTGLTAHSDLFVLERCAADARMKLRFEAFHDCRGAETVTHWLNQGDERSAFALVTAGNDWPAVLAHSVLEDAGLQRQSPLRLTTTIARAADHPGTLVSWLIA
jgi:hypothetical protein